MRLSVITPTLNSLKFIEDCIGNVAAQGDAVFEHIIVDGGSTDGTLERIERLCATHKNLRLIPGPDKGQSDAMNKGTAAARGDIIGVLNVDDYYEPGAIRAAMTILAAATLPTLVVGDCRVVDENGNEKYWNRPRDLRVETLLLGWPYGQFPCNPSAYFYHKRVHDLVGGYDVRDHYAMDFDFLLSCAEKVQTRYVASHWGNFRLIPGCKTYDDASGAQRIAAITARHKAKLSQRQLLRMMMIKTRFDLHIARKRVLERLRRQFGHGAD
jgi:glycosyltransferase involved in cell wall biosynthesis